MRWPDPSVGGARARLPDCRRRNRGGSTSRGLASLDLRLASLLGLGIVVSALIPHENPVCLNYLRLRCRVYGSRIIAARHSEVDW